MHTASLLNDKEKALAYGWKALAYEKHAQVDSESIDKTARTINEQTAKLKEEGASKGDKAQARKKTEREMVRVVIACTSKSPLARGRS